MAINARDFKVTGQWAKDAATDVPPSPLSGQAYRNAALTREDAERGQQYDVIWESARNNQKDFEATGIAKMVSEYGIVLWSPLEDYGAGAIQLGTDEIPYRCMKANGPGTADGAKDPTVAANVGENSYWLTLASYVTAGISGGVPTTRTITATSPLTGGGDLSADRSIGIQDATTARKGATQLATVAEAKAGTLATKAVTPAGLASALAEFDPGEGDTGWKILGEIRLFGHRSTALPAGWYYPSGQYYALTSAIGAALNALPATLKSDWGITTSGSTIRLCDNTKFFEGTLGRFPRPVNNSNRYPGSVETDAMRQITGTVSSSGTVTTTGLSTNAASLAALVKFSNTDLAPTGALSTTGSQYTYTSDGSNTSLTFQRMQLNARTLMSGATVTVSSTLNLTQSGTVASENRPYNVGMTPAIYLGV